MAVSKTATIFRIPLLLGLALGVALHAATASATLLDFEGLDATCDANNAAANGVPNGYGGLNWSSVSGAFGSDVVGLECDANYQSASFFNNTYGAPSPTYAAYNSQAFGGIVVTPVSGSFDFLGAQFSSFVQDNGTGAGGYEPFSAYSVRLEGYQGVNPTPAFTLELDLYADDGVNITPAQYYSTGVLAWTGLSALGIFAGDLPLAFTPTFGDDGRLFLMDEVEVTLNEAPIPEPGTALLLLAGLAALARKPSRRRA